MKEKPATFAWIAIAFVLFSGVALSLGGIPVAANHGSQTRFWVGGVVGCVSDVWSDTACWSTSSGGLGGASVPDQHTDVVCDALSGAISPMTIDVTASMHDFTGTGCSVTSIEPGAQIVNFYGNITDIEPDWSVATATVSWRADDAATIANAGLNWNIRHLTIDGVGPFTVDNGGILLISAGDFLATVDATIKVDPTAPVGALVTSDGTELIAAEPGNLLTLRSVITGTRWIFNAQGERPTCLRCDVKDMDYQGGGTFFLNDASNVNSGNNVATGGGTLVLTPKSSIVEETSGFFTISSLDYGPQTVRNSAGNIVAIYADGTSVNNGDLYARYSTDGGLTWSSRVHLHGTPDGIVDDTIGTGWELFLVVDQNDVLHIAGHKLISGSTHIWYSQVSIANVANVATFSNWKSAAGVAVPSSGNSENGMGIDYLSLGLSNVLDPSVAVSLAGVPAVAWGDSDAGAGWHVARFSGGWTRVNVDPGTQTFDTIVDVLSDSNDVLHVLSNPDVGGADRDIQHWQCDPAAVNCMTAANWKGAGGDAFDYVISSSTNEFNFVHPTVDADGRIHATAAGNTQVGGFNRLFHNFLNASAVSWAYGDAQNAAGIEINGGQAFPARTRLTSSQNSRTGIQADTLGNVFVSYQDNQLDTMVTHKWNGTTLVWGSQVVYMIANGRLADLHSRGGVGFIDVFSSDSAAHAAIYFIAIPTETPEANPWWDPAAVPPSTPCLSDEQPLAASIIELAWAIIPIGVLLIIIGLFGLGRGESSGGGLGGIANIGPSAIAIISLIVGAFIIVLLAGALMSGLGSAIC